MITPETSTSSHYLWGVARPYQIDDAELTEFIRAQSEKTFEEDEVMLAARQRSLGETGGSTFPVPLKMGLGF
ncbi:aromatic ring-hydroxylating dioxygenase subunit alpha, partial [Verminephrobacter sp. Larva24]